MSLKIAMKNEKCYYATRKCIFNKKESNKRVKYKTHTASRAKTFLGRRTRNIIPTNVTFFTGFYIDKPFDLSTYTILLKFSKYSVILFNIFLKMFNRIFSHNNYLILL